MPYQFSLILNREITDQETKTLTEASPVSVTFADDVLPVNAEVRVTRIDFEDDVMPGLAEAIEAGFELIKTIPDLSIPGLRVPAQSAKPDDGQDEEPAQEAAEVTSTIAGQRLGD